MFVFIASTDRTSDVIKNSIQIEDILQETTDKASFRLKGNLPNEFDDVKIYDGFTIRSATANTITLNVKQDCNSIFRAGDSVFVAIGESDEEKATISSTDFNGLYLRLTMTANFTNTPAANELAGKLSFAGNILDISDRNIDLLENIEYNIRCVDYTRIFDKELVNETYDDKDSRYIVNDFCNDTVNNNKVIDEMNYADNSSIQAEWIETGDGDNPTTDTSDYQEGSASGVLPWTNSGGTATFTASPTSADFSDFTGVASGTPTKGVLGFWYKAADHTKVTSFDVRIGSDASNYASVTVTPSDNLWVFVDEKLSDASIIGTPVWTALDYIAVVITETDDSSIQFDGFRVLEEEFFRHYPNVQTSSAFDSFNIARTKPTEVMQRMSDELSWFWYIDYERNIHFFSDSTGDSSPFDLDETSNNFRNLRITTDVSKLVNKQIVEGGEETSDATYAEANEGDGFQREWLMKNKFKNLVVGVDKNTVTDTMEAGTTTTNVTATTHGLSVDDFIVNRSRSNAVRKVLTVPDPNNFTVEAVTGQTTGDTFSTFVTQAVGVEGLNVDAGNNYMSNFNEKSIRSAEGEDTLVATEFISFKYNEVVPILVQRRNTASINSLKSTLGYTNGVFEGQKIIDKSLKTRTEANSLAGAVLNKWSNAIITATFTTNINGLKSGQIINIKDTTSSTRNINQDFMIQRVVRREIQWGFYEYTVTCSSVLFGMLELLQQLLRQNRKLQISEDQVVNNLEDAIETLTISDTLTTAVNDNEFTETLTLSDGDAVTTEVVTPPFKWAPSGTKEARWSLFSWG